MDVSALDDPQSAARCVTNSQLSHCSILRVVDRGEQQRVAVSYTKVTRCY